MTDVTPSAYTFDPELAEFASVSAHPAPTDAVAARELSNQYLSAMGADVDTSGLESTTARSPDRPERPT